MNASRVTSILNVSMGRYSVHANTKTAVGTAFIGTPVIASAINEPGLLYLRTHQGPDLHLW